MANNAPPPPPPRTGLSLYANLLDPSNNTPGTISSAPVTYNQSAAPSLEDEATKKQQALAASLRFQPTKRPQIAAQKAKAKAVASKLSALPKPADSQGNKEALANSSVVVATPPSSSLAQKSTAADWIATASDDEDVNAYYAGSRQRGGRKKRKKTKDTAQDIQHDWDDIYDPTRPNNYEVYKHSEEKIREVREWKDLLYRHRMQGNRSSDISSDNDSSINGKRNKQFAPPPSMSFAPPSHFDVPPPPPHEEATEDDGDEADEYVPPPAASVPDDATGDNAFARRMRMSGVQMSPQSLAGPPQPSLGQISRAPVRYNFPPPDPELPSTEAELQEMELDDVGDEEEQQEAARSMRPGQAKFAERLMAKYGWSKGQGLGKGGTGVTSALYAKVDKRKKKSDAEGGGYATPATTGRIMGGKQSQAGKEAEEGKFGAMSEVVRLQGMLKGMNLQAEIANEQGGIMQEIGEECNEKYGNVERVYIHADTQEASGAFVFVHFTNQLSALRAVNALEGRIFNGNEIKARFWTKESFEKGEYE